MNEYADKLFAIGSGDRSEYDEERLDYDLAVMLGSCVRGAYKGAKGLVRHYFNYPRFFMKNGEIDFADAVAPAVALYLELCIFNLFYPEATQDVLKIRAAQHIMSI